jgi:hypothetical protein
MAWLRLLVGGSSPWKPGFDSRPVRVSFVMKCMASRQVFLPVFRFSPRCIIPAMLYTNLHCTLLLPSDTRSPGTPPPPKKSNAVSEIWGHGTEENFRFFLFQMSDGLWNRVSRDMLLFAGFPIIIKGPLDLASKPLMQGWPKHGTRTSFVRLSPICT